MGIKKPGDDSLLDAATAIAEKRNGYLDEMKAALESIRKDRARNHCGCDACKRLRQFATKLCGL